MTYDDEVWRILTSSEGSDAVLRLMALFEEADIPVRGVNIEVKVAPSPKRRQVGTLFGTVSIEVTA